MDDDELLIEKPEVFLFKIPKSIQRKQGYLHRAADWDISNPDWYGKIAIFKADPSCHVQLEDRKGNIYGQAVIDEYPGKTLVPVLDSSRYFTLNIQDIKGNFELVGIGFSSRNDSAELNSVLTDYFAQIAKCSKKKRGIQKAETNKEITAKKILSEDAPKVIKAVQPGGRVSAVESSVSGPTPAKQPKIASEEARVQDEAKVVGEKQSHPISLPPEKHIQIKPVAKVQAQVHPPVLLSEPGVAKVQSTDTDPSGKHDLISAPKHSTPTTPVPNLASTISKLTAAIKKPEVPLVAAANEESSSNSLLENLTKVSSLPRQSSVILKPSTELASIPSTKPVSSISAERTPILKKNNTEKLNAGTHMPAKPSSVNTNAVQSAAKRSAANLKSILKKSTIQASAPLLPKVSAAPPVLAPIANSKRACEATVDVTNAAVSKKTKPLVPYGSPVPLVPYKEDLTADKAETPKPPRASTLPKSASVAVAPMKPLLKIPLGSTSAVKTQDKANIIDEPRLKEDATKIESEPTNDKLNLPENLNNLKTGVEKETGPKLHCLQGTAKPENTAISTVQVTSGTVENSIVDTPNASNSEVKTDKITLDGDGTHIAITDSANYAEHTNIELKDGSEDESVIDEERDDFDGTTEDSEEADCPATLAEVTTKCQGDAEQVPKDTMDEPEELLEIPEEARNEEYPENSEGLTNEEFSENIEGVENAKYDEYSENVENEEILGIDDAENEEYPENLEEGDENDYTEYSEGVENEEILGNLEDFENEEYLDNVEEVEINEEPENLDDVENFEDSANIKPIEDIEMEFEMQESTGDEVDVSADGLNDQIDEKTEPEENPTAVQIYDVTKDPNYKYFSDGVFHCHKCSETFDDARATKFHWSSVHKLKKTTYCQCGLPFPVKIELEKHKKKYHPCTFFCLLCNRHFNTDSDVDRHLLQIHRCHNPQGKKFSSVNSKITCEVCSDTFIHKFKFVKHWRANHNQEVDEKVADLEESDAKADIDETEYVDEDGGNTKAEFRIDPVSIAPGYKYMSGADFKCHMCPETYQDMRRIKSHWKTVHKFRSPAHCVVCKLPFPSVAEMSQHRKNSHGFTCSECGKQFKKEIGLNDHVRNAHQKKMEMACKICGAIFKLRFQLLKHIESQHADVKGEVLHQCQQCHEKFLNAEDLAKHVVIHQFLNYCCDRCDRKFSSKSAVRNHYQLDHPGFTMPTNEELGFGIS